MNLNHQPMKICAGLFFSLLSFFSIYFAMRVCCNCVVFTHTKIDADVWEFRRKTSKLWIDTSACGAKGMWKRGFFLL